MECSLKDALLKLQAADFAAEDMKLYLDTHPNDTAMLMKYQMQVQKAAMLKNEIECKYRYPLSARGVSYGPSFSWINNPWPWNYDFPPEVMPASESGDNGINNPCYMPCMPCYNNGMPNCMTNCMMEDMN